MIQHIKASNLLSFGPDGLDLEMRNLNVLIGPNGSGKSNFLEIFELLRALPRGEEDNENWMYLIQRGGGFQEWIWKGTSEYKNVTPISIELETTKREFHNPLIHTIEIYDISFDENISSLRTGKNIFKKRNGIVYHWETGGKILEKGDVDWFKGSVLSQGIPNSDFDLRSLKSDYQRIYLYREWSFGRNSIFRTPQRADMRNDRLESDYSNLGMFLMRLRKEPATKRALIAALQDLYAGITDFEVIAEGGYVQILFTEGDYSVPAIRLSDGTLRYLCLLAILLDPTPPPLICIEEPELGLHPDIMPKLADLLVDASSRTQLIVTTHSDVLIDALGNSGHAESVLVCEKHDGQTQIRRLQEEDLAHWLKDYGLGQLWMRGEIGGTRW